MFKALKNNVSKLGIAIAMTLGLSSSMPGAAQAQTGAPEKPTPADLLNRAQLEKFKAGQEALRTGRAPLPSPNIEQRAPLPSQIEVRPPSRIEIRPPIDGGAIMPAQSLRQATRSDDLKPIIAGVIKEFEKRLSQARPGKPVYLLFGEDDHESIPQKLVLQAVAQYFKTLGDKRGFKILYTFEQPHNDLLRLTQNYVDQINPGKKLSADWMQQVDPDGSEALKALLTYSRIEEGSFSHANLQFFMHENGITTKAVDSARDGAVINFDEPETRKMGLKFFKGQIPPLVSLRTREGSYFRNRVMADQMQREAARLQASVVIMNMGNAHGKDRKDEDPRWLSIPTLLRAQGATVLLADFDTNGIYIFEHLSDPQKDRIIVPVPSESFKDNVPAEITATEKFCAKLPDVKYCFNKEALNDPYKQQINARLREWVGLPAGPAVKPF